MRHRTGWKRLISPDLRIKAIIPWGSGKAKKQHTLRPGQLAEVSLHRRFSIPAGSDGRIPLPAVSTRSVAARLGVNAGTGQHQIHETLASGMTPERVSVMHQGRIPVRLREGQRILRFYFPQIAMPLRRQEIRQFIKSGELVLGKGFKLLESGMIEITPHNVTYDIPRKTFEQITKENWLSGSKRKKFMELLHRKKISPRTSSRHIVLSETTPVKLPKDVAMFFTSSSDGVSTHINSHLIDPGFEGPIVLEIQGNIENKKPDTIIAWLARAK